MIESIYNSLKRSTKSATSLLKILLRSKLISKIPSAENDTIVILGTGPSLATTLTNHLSVLQGMDTMGLNHFAEKEEFEKLKPKFYMIGAPEIWEEGLDAYYTEKGIRLFEAINKKTSWPMTLIMGNQGKKSARVNIINNPKVSIVYINRTPIEGSQYWSKILMDRQWGMPRPHNVLVPSIMSSIWMGKKKIFLVGADHSWHEQIRTTDNNKVEMDQQHYYDTGTNWKPMKRKGKRDRKIYEIFEKLTLSFKAYIELEAYAEKKRVKIYNASYKTYIDAFERKLLPLDSV